MLDMPPLPSFDYQEQCIQRAAAHYGAHPDLVRAVVRVEGGKAGVVSKNTNGTFDMGVMQINSIHLPMLARYGITKEMLVSDECLNIHIGTYLLQKGIMTGRDFWHGVGAYHSKTPALNEAYQKRVWIKLQTFKGGRK